jgi:N utilization substance protein A
MSTNTTNSPEEIRKQIEFLCIERNLDLDEVMAAIESSIASAYRREFGDKELAYDAKFNLETGKYDIYEVTAVVDEILNPGKEILVVEAKLSDPSLAEGDIIRKQVTVAHEMNFGRIAAQVAKQVLSQSIHNTRHTKVLQQFKDKIGDLVTVEVDGFRKGGYMVKISQTMGFISRDNLLPIDRFRPGQLIKALILDITEDDRGYSKIVLSRSHIDFVTAIIRTEVPEVGAGLINLVKIVREAGSRTKILVSANEYERNIDPVGTILGRKNVRLVNIMREISSSMQEKIDIVEYRPEDLEGMIIDALEPAEIERVEIDNENKTAEVYCYPEEASLAVGKRGVNIRLAGALFEFELNLHTIEDEHQPKADNEVTDEEDTDKDHMVISTDSEE